MMNIPEIKEKQKLPLHMKQDKAIRPGTEDIDEERI